MRNELLLYAELLIDLTGALLYGFLTRELLRRPHVLPGNWPLRALLIAVTAWHGGTLGDHLFYLLGQLPERSWAGTSLDLLRGLAWLLTHSFLVHTLAWTLGAGAALDGGDRLSPRRLWLRLTVAAGYAPLALFVAPAVAFARAGQPLLGVAADAAQLRVALHTTLTLGLAAFLAWRAAGKLGEPRVRRFLRLLSGILAILSATWATTAALGPTPEAGLREWLHAALLGAWLVPGGIFAFYVQRYNLLRLSLSHRTLRHFLAALLLVLLVMLAGPALGLENVQIIRRFVAWGLVVALFAGLAYAPLVDRLLRRSAGLRRLFGRALSPRQIDELLSSIENLEPSDGEARRRICRELSRWLGTEARFLEATDQERPFWAFFEKHPDVAVIHRLRPPSSALAMLLERRALHTVFALRVDGRLEGLLGLSISATGGAYSESEVEEIQLVIRQLAGTLALRRLLAERLAEQRRLDESERLGVLGLVAASLAHEVKNPLSSMKALAQSLREDLAAAAPESDGVADLDAIVAQIDRLDRTTREILGIARPRPGESTELRGVVESACYVLRAEARKRAVDLATEIGDVGEVVGSPAAWQTVVFNLVLNAVEHTPAGAAVGVSLRRNGDHVRFATTNPGPPIDEPAHLFEPFVSAAGTGLGLALVARRAGELGGQIDVSHDGERVVFEVTALLSPSHPGDRSA